MMNDECFFPLAASVIILSQSMEKPFKILNFVVKLNGMQSITHISQLDPDGVYSYADYLSWKFEQALEIIKGKIFPLSAPSFTHQKLSWKLTVIFDRYFKNHPCETLAAPFDVRLYNRAKSKKTDKDIYSVIQPDLCVVCDLKKIDEKGCLGAPDLVVEILSPGNSTREMKLKKDLYQESGVSEYWIVDPVHETVARYNVESDGVFSRPLIFVSADVMPSVIFPDFRLSLGELFPPIEEPIIEDTDERL